MKSLSNPLDELEALFREVRKDLSVGKSPHSYHPQVNPHHRAPDHTRLNFDADRFRWWFSKRENTGGMGLEEWRRHVDALISAEAQRGET